MTHHKLVLASILIVATGLMVINSPMMIGNAQGQLYSSEYGYDNNYYQDDNRYTYDKKDPSTYTNIQKINCDTRNINVNGIDITQVPEDTTTTNELQANNLEDDLDSTNGNSGKDRINFDRNLVNVCVNVNQNEQIKVNPPEASEEGGQDLAVANSLDEDVSIFLGNGDGSFGFPPTDFITGSEPRFVAVGLFNADSNQDLAVVNGADFDVSILLGNGDGTFGAATDFLVGNGPQSVAVGLFNADSNQDLAVVSRDEEKVAILLGNGDGTFGAAATFPTGEQPVFVAVGEFD